MDASPLSPAEQSAAFDPLAHSQLLAPDFSPLEHARELLRHIQASDTQDAFAQLSNTLSTAAHGLNLHLRHQVATPSHQAQLIAQISGVRQVDAALTQAEAQVRELKQLMHGLRVRIRVPHTQAQAYTRQAANLQRAAALVRGTARFVQLHKRLQTLVADSQDEAVEPEWTAVALVLRDIERTVVANGLTGVAVVDRETAQTLAPLRERAHRAGESLLAAGMQRGSTGDAAAGLAVLDALGELSTVVDGIVRRRAAEWATEVAAAPLTGADVWAGVSLLADAFLVHALQLRTLDSAMARRRRQNQLGATADGRLDSAAEEGSLPSTWDGLAFWWRAAVAALAARLLAPPVRALLAASVPRLAQLLLPKLEPLLATGQTIASSSNSNSNHRALQPTALWDALLAPLAQEHVRRARARMSSALSQCFSLRTTASQEDRSARQARVAVRVMVSEVQIAAADRRLGAMVEEAAGEALQEALAGAQIRASTLAASSALQPGAPPSDALREYVAILSAVFALRYELHSIDDTPSLAALTVDSAMLLARVLDNVSDRVTAALVAPQADIEAAEGALQWLQSHILQGLRYNAVGPPEELCALVSHVLRLYVSRACLAYPLTEDAKLDAAASASRLEFDCSQIVKLEYLKESDAVAGSGYAVYSALRQLRPLLFMDAKQLAEKPPAIVDVLRPVDLVNHIICRVATECGASKDLLPESILEWTSKQMCEADDTRQLRAAQRQSLQLLKSRISEADSADRKDDHALWQRLIDAALEIIPEN
ncbi:hypothetical protein GGI07_005659 [Coemansia sp. Benny D115]|nr:hypothetical protein GGI07_005659 [Coemansia sp. Benny D115]